MLSTVIARSAATKQPRTGQDDHTRAKVAALIFDAHMPQPAVYIMASARNGTLYTGVTSDLPRRAYEHRTAAHPGFTAQYGCRLLVFYAFYADMPTAIAREKQIKGGSRKKKLALIETLNPNWRDLYTDLA